MSDLKPSSNRAVCFQDSPNEQGGLFLEVLLPWPASPEIKAQLTLLLQAHPGRSLSVTLAVPRSPSIAWQGGPEALGFTPNPITWQCAPHLSLSLLYRPIFPCLGVPQALARSRSWKMAHTIVLDSCCCGYLCCSWGCVPLYLSRFTRVCDASSWLCASAGRKAAPTYQVLW